MVHLPVSSHRNIGLPQANNGSAFPQRSVQRLQYGSDFETAVIPLCSGPQVCSPLRSLPPQSKINQSGCDFYVRASHGSLPHRAPDMLVVRIGQLTTWGLTPHKILGIASCSPDVISALFVWLSDPLSRRVSQMLIPISYLKTSASPGRPEVRHTDLPLQPTGKPTYSAFPTSRGKTVEPGSATRHGLLGTPGRNP